MRKPAWAILSVLVLILLLPGPSASAATGKEARRVDSAADVLARIMEIPEKSIPPELLENARGIAIVPGVVKVGFVVGGQYGHGVLLVRENGGGWSNPVFVTMASGSAGWQIGAESTDFVLVFKTPRSVDGILKGKFTLGADASVAAGPVGRNAEAATDIQLKAEICSYSRTRGLFAGISLEGSSLQVDSGSDTAYYGKGGGDTSAILAGKGISAPPEAEKLVRELATYAPGPPKKS